MIQAAPYIALGVFLAIELALVIISCVLDKNAYALIIIVPLCFAIICQFLADSYSDGYHEEGLLTVDTINWFFGVAFAASIGIPLMLWHDKLIKDIGLGLTLGAVVIQLISYWVFNLSLIHI